MVRVANRARVDDFNITKKERPEEPDKVSSS